MNTFSGIQPILAPPLTLTFREDHNEDHEELYALQLLTFKNGMPLKLEEKHFEREEWNILLPLLNAYPFYVSSETLLAAKAGQKRPCTTQHLQESTLRRKLRSVHGIINRINEKLAVFRFTLLEIHKYGYTLALLEERGNSTSSSLQVNKPLSVENRIEERYACISS